jgi:hypothetical protein
MAKVVELQMIGGAYHNGRYYPGWGNIRLDNGKRLYVGEKESNGWKALLDYADQQGYDIEEMRAKVENWVKTGRMG